MINLHCHTLTYGMFGNHPHWGPTWENGTMKIGNWHLGTKKDRPLEPLMETLSHQGLLRQMEERGIVKVVLSAPAHMYLYWAGEFGTEFARIVNNALSAFCADMPD